MRRDDVTSVKRRPDFLVVGAAKAGTTSLYAYLAAHPGVYMSPVKEPHFYSRVEPDPRVVSIYTIVRDDAAYARLFEPAGERVAGEASTSYLCDPTAPARIAADVPGARIVIMLREPVERAHSHYLNGVREGLEGRSFEDAVRAGLAGEPPRWGAALYVDLGRYCAPVRRYVDLFGDRVLVLFFEEFFADVRAQFARVCSFLGVDEGAAALEPGVHNPYAAPRSRLSTALLGSPAARALGRRLVPPRGRAAFRSVLLRAQDKPPIDERVRRLLEDAYRDEPACLERLLGRPVPWVPP